MLTAMYTTWCSDCRTEIKPGDVIDMTDEGAVHAECAAGDGANASETACTACNLVHAGECW